MRVNCADLLSEKSENVLSLTLFEPNPLCFLRADKCFDALSDIDFMYAAFCEVVADKNPDAAQLLTNFYGGVGFSETLLDLIKRYFHDTLSANLSDWRTAKSYRYYPAQIAAFEVPALLGIRRGERSNDAQCNIWVVSAI